MTLKIWEEKLSYPINSGETNDGQLRKVVISTFIFHGKICIKTNENLKRWEINIDDKDNQ